MKDKEDLLIKFDTRADSRGLLTFTENDGRLPFQVQRVFWIHGIPEFAIRGAHAHRTCAEIIIPVHGSFKVDIVDGKNKRISFTMSQPDQGLHIPAMTWCELKDFASDTVCLCLASELYCPEGYINDFQTFLSECAS